MPVTTRSKPSVEPDLGGGAEGQGELAGGDEDPTVEDRVPGPDDPVGEPSSGQSRQVDGRRVEAVDGGGPAHRQPQTPGLDGIHHEEDEDPPHPVVGEPLPHLGEEEGGQTTGVAEKAPFLVDRWRPVPFGSCRTPDCRSRMAIGAEPASPGPAENRENIPDALPEGKRGRSGARPGPPRPALRLPDGARNPDHVASLNRARRSRRLLIDSPSPRV